MLAQESEESAQKTSTLDGGFCRSRPIQTTGARPPARRSQLSTQGPRRRPKHRVPDSQGLRHAENQTAVLENADALAGAARGAGVRNRVTFPQG